MDGDLAPLPELVNLKDRYDTWLLVDEAHATGLYGATRRGLAEACGVADRIEVQMGTLGKALGSAGGYIVGARELIECLVNGARSFIFSTAPVPAQAAAAAAAVAIVQSDEGRRLAGFLWERVTELRRGLAGLGWTVGAEGIAPVSAILPLMVRTEATALALAERLHEAGCLVPAIRFPTVARGAARLRITVSAAHTAEDVARLLAALEVALVDLGVPAHRQPAALGA
jgi:7-keto-8-aminopelargonate synthetase-like enzyme